MILKEYPAGPATRGTIRVYRIVHFTGPLARPAVKVYPSTAEQSLQLFVHEPEVAEYPDGRRLSWSSAIVGAHDVTVRRHVPSPFLMVQAVFEPGALFRLTGIPGQELRNSYVDASAVWGSGALTYLRQEIGDANSYAKMIATTEAFIAALPERSSLRRIQRQLQQLRDRACFSIDQAAAQSSLSLRQFERTCQLYTGVAPRELASLARFDRAFHVKLHRPGLDWLSIAVDCGYYDYQHMAREFRLFSGLTPPRLIETQHSSPEHRLGVPHQFNLSYGSPGA